MRSVKKALGYVFLFLTLSMLSISPRLQAAKPEDYFFVHIIAPTSDPVTMQCAQLLEKELPKIGIETELHLINQAVFESRVTDQEVGAYTEGGYDIAISGMSMGSPVTHQGDYINRIFGANSIPPYGYNAMYWSPETGKGYNNYRAQESEDLIQKINTNWNLTETTEDFIEWQKVWYDAMPMCVIYNEYEAHAVSAGMYGYDPQKFPLNSLETTWLTNSYLGPSDTVICAVRTSPSTLNSYLATDRYSKYATDPVMDTLYDLSPSPELHLPAWINRTQWMIDNYGIDAYYVQYPRMAAAIGNFSSDGLTYDVSVRSDVIWHDGHILDAWDVAFSFQAVLTPVLGVPEYSSYVVSFGADTDNIGIDPLTWSHGNYSFKVLDKNGDGHDEFIRFTLNETNAFIEYHYIGGHPILPEHILGNQTNHGFNGTGHFDTNLWDVKPKDWVTHSFNTGRTSDPGGLTGPIGTGSMVFKLFNQTTSEVTFEKFENIWWDGDSWEANASSDHYLVKDGKLTTIPKVAKIIVWSMDESLSAMKAGEINIMDPQFTLSTIYEELESEDSIQVLTTSETGYLALYFNPKFTQDGIQHLNKKGVRHAISHMIPREDIVEYLLNGLGCPAYTPVPVTAQFGGVPIYISENDFIAYKRNLRATDGTTPLSDTTTPHDKYSLDLAYDWLDTEGYDTVTWSNGDPTSSTTVLSSTTDLFTTASLAVLILFIELFTFFTLFFLLQKLKR
ncbi:MAG: ABC transporter substrate-binding protein [Candidatus Hodarchaeota archaeon]